MEEALQLLEQLIEVSHIQDKEKEKGGISFMTNHLIVLKEKLEEIERDSKDASIERDFRRDV